MEKWDLYDINRIKLGTTITRGEAFNGRGYHMVVRVIIYDGDGKILIQKRAAQKDSYPSYWDFSAAGSALAGETSLEALKRETREEIGFILPDSVIRPAFTLNFDEGFDDFYFCEVEHFDPGSLKLQKEEVAEVRWASREEITELKNGGMFIPFSSELISLCLKLTIKNSWFENK